MSVGIPLPELDLQKPAQAPFPDALSEFQRASQLQTAAAQQQAIMAQTQAQQQQNQAQGLQLQDEMLYRQLAPQHVQKDENGKITGMDLNGLYADMQARGANVLPLQMKQVEIQKAMIGLGDAQLEHQQKINAFMADHLESVRDANNAALAKQSGGATVVPQSAGAATAPSTQQPFGPPPPPGVTAAPLPAPNTGAAPPGTPQSLGQPEPGAAPTPSESALQQSAKGVKPMTPEGQAAYQRFVLEAAKMGIPVQQFKANLVDTSDLDQAEAGLGLHTELMKMQKAQADIEEAKGKGAASQAEAAKSNIISVPELGGAYHVDEGVFKPYGNGQVMSPAMLESKYVMDQAMKQRTGKSPDPQFDKGYEKFKTLVPVANINLQAGLLNDQAKQMAAQSYQQTGQLPAGMRSPAMAAGILNTAATAPGGVPNIAANKQQYAANTKSLESLQKNADQVAAFENTAGKNLDVFLNTARPILDSGSPWINKPLRSIDAGALGSADQAAFNAARVTAVTEIAKVLNSSNASGVLSDSARHEIEGLIGPNASLKQIYSAANVLKQDMANRHQAYQQQLAEIRGRSSGNAPAEQSAPATGKVISAATIQQAAKDHGVSVEEATKQAKAAGYTIQ